MIKRSSNDAKMSLRSSRSETRIASRAPAYDIMQGDIKQSTNLLDDPFDAASVPFRFDNRIQRLPLNHSFIPSELSVDLCPVHSQPMSFYCLSDNVWMCSTCILEGHKSHNYISHKEAFAAFKRAEIEGDEVGILLNEMLETQAEQLHGLVSKMDVRCKHLQQRLDTIQKQVVQSINERFLSSKNRLKTAFEELRSELLGAESNGEEFRRELRGRVKK